MSQPVSFRALSSSRRRWVLPLLLVFGLTAALSPLPAQAQSSITGEAVACQDGSAAQYPCENVDLLSYLSTDDLGGVPGIQINDIWGWTDPQTGTEYALVGRSDAIAFVDVSTPTEPVYLGELPTHSEPSSWRDVKTYENHAFVVSEAPSHGMQVFDLTQLRDVTSNGRPVAFSETAHYDRVGKAHNIALNTDTGFAYIIGGNGEGTTCGGGLHMVNVQTPTAPSFAGCFADPSTGRASTGYTHDTQCVIYQGPDTDYQGNEVCFNANETALNIADVTNKNDPSTITNATYPQIGYVHQAWLTEDQRYLYVDDEFDERQGSVDSTRTMVYDVTNLDNPELVTTYKGPTGAIDHNQYIVDNYSYQANYQSGLRILNVAAPENPAEVAYFDTYPSANDASFDGAWSVYPFYERNMVVVSSIGEGLFVLRPEPPPVFSLRGTRQGQGARFQWSVTAGAQTARLHVERKPPRSNTWQSAGTISAKSGAGIQEYEFAFEDLDYGTHQVRVRHVSTSGDERVSTPASVQILPSESYAARGPFPNPAQDRATFTITLRETQPLHVALYDVLGRRVRLLHDGPVEKGVTRRFRIRAAQWASGTYFLRAKGPSAEVLRKVVIVK